MLSDRMEIEGEIITAESFLESLRLPGTNESLIEVNFRYIEEKKSPFYSTDRQHETLLSYIYASLESIRVKTDHEDQKTFEANYRKFYAEKQALEEKLRVQLDRDVLGQNNEAAEVYMPDIIPIIKSAISELEKKNKIMAIRNVFQGYTEDYLHGLNRIELASKYNQAMNVAHTYEATNNILHYLSVVKSNLQEPIKVERKSMTSGSYTTTERALQSLEYSIAVSDEALGYSIHHLFTIAGLLPDREVYMGGCEFCFSYENLVKLKEYLSDLFILYKDFTAILDAVLGKDADQYLRTGAKPLSEVIKTERARQEKKMPLFIHPDVTQRLNALPQNQNRMVFLFPLPAINLTEHPNRDEMKALLEWLYKINDLKDSKGGPKTFIQQDVSQQDSGPGYQYVSLLSLDHIRFLFKDIMYLSELTHVAIDMGFVSPIDPGFLQIVGVSDASSLFHRFLLSRLVGMGQRLLGTKKFGMLESEIRAVFPEFFSKNKPFSAIYARFNTVLGDLLNKYVSVIREPMHIDPIELTPEDCLVLLPKTRRATAAYPMTEQDIDTLCQKLEACDAYPQAAIFYQNYVQALGIQSGGVGQDIAMPLTLQDCMTQLTAEFKRRIAICTRDSQSITLQPSLNQALQTLMNIASKIVYHAKLQIPLSAIDKAMQRLADIFQVQLGPQGRRDLEQGCNTGFAGRLVTADTQLLAVQEDPIGAANQQLLIDAVEQTFTDTIARSSDRESSMAANKKPHFLYLLGLVSRFQEEAYPNDIESFMQDLVTRYNPAAIYNACFETIRNNFQHAAREDNDDAIYELLSFLGYPVQTDKEREAVRKYLCIGEKGEKWSISKFQEALYEKLLSKLIAIDLLQPSVRQESGQLIVNDVSGTPQYRYPFYQNILNKRERIKQEQLATQRHQFFPPLRTTAAPQPPTPAAAPRNPYRVFERVGQGGAPSIATEEEIRRVADVAQSKAAQEPQSGSFT